MSCNMCPLCVCLQILRTVQSVVHSHHISSASAALPPPSIDTAINAAVPAPVLLVTPSLRDREPLASTIGDSGSGIRIPLELPDLMRENPVFQRARLLWSSPWHLGGSSRNSTEPSPAISSPSLEMKTAPAPPPYAPAGAPSS
jgi:hypothetical protein